MELDRLTQSIRIHEGYREIPYRDSLGLWTVGHGHLIEHTELRGWMPHRTIGSFLTALCNPEQHDLWLENDIDGAIRRAKSWMDCFDDLSDLRQEVLAEMCFQLGGRVSGFVKFKAAVEAGDFEEAARQMIDSRWCEQTPARVKVLSQRMRDNR